MLQFSQEASASQGLSNFGSLCLSSQPQHSQLSQDSRPVPMFASSEDAAVECSQQDVLVSQEMLGTQDFITPADQFQLEYDPINGEANQQRSPGRISPNRMKRPRKDVRGETGELEEDGLSSSQKRTAGLVGTSGRDMQPVRMVPRRPKSPPCYRSIFSEEDEDCFAPWEAPRNYSRSSRYLLDYREIGQLGQGNFSKVLRARHRLNGNEYAIKRSLRELSPEDPAFAQFLQEAQVLASLPPHPHIVQYYTSWTEQGSHGEFLYHQLEKCDISLGSLVALGESRLREAEMLEVLRQMCLALQHLHSHGVAHLDVKPDNIYTVGSADNGDQLLVKLGDFGQATRFKGSAPKVVDEGDSRYLPLEVLNSNYRYLDKADMFALGATMFELASRKELPSGGQLYQDLRNSRVPLLPSISTSLFNLIKSLLSHRPEDRPSAEKVLALPLLNKKRVTSPGLQPQGSTNSAQSAHSGDGRLGGLVLHRSLA